VTVVDFAALPPEINSGRMYAGAGSAPLVAAAAAWQGLASELGSAATSYRAVISDLTGAWVGPSSLSMAAAATPYAAWMNTTAAQAEQTASQLGAAIAAYEAAFTATVPPPLIAANRALLAALVATNILGQNTPAIAATEAQYAQMWAQDAGAMYGYAGASAAATTLTPFTPPPQTTNPAATATQASAVTQAAGTSAGATQNTLSQVPNTLQSLDSGDPSQLLLDLLNNPWITDFETIGAGAQGFIGAYGASVVTAAGSLFIPNPMINAAVMAAKIAATTPAAAVPEAAAPAAGVGGLAGPLGGGGGVSAGGVSAGLSRAATVGGLSVPQSWATASPAIRLAATTLPAAGLDSVPQVGAAGFGGSFGGMPPIIGGVNAPQNGAAGPRPESRVKVIPQLGGESGEGTPGRRGNAPRRDSALSEREELNGLRQAIAELAKERDVLMRSAARLMKEATS
jgi:PPE-repeat protein